MLMSQEPCCPTQLHRHKDKRSRACTTSITTWTTSRSITSTATTARSSFKTTSATGVWNSLDESNKTKVCSRRSSSNKQQKEQQQEPQKSNDNYNYCVCMIDGIDNLAAVGEPLLPPKPARNMTPINYEQAKQEQLGVPFQTKRVVAII